jgi:hypothetical protein
MVDVSRFVEVPVTSPQPEWNQAMLSKCANPECSKPFQYLREGRLFLVEAGALNGGNGASPGPQLVGKRPQRKVEHFWLCGDCARTLTLAVEPGRGVVVVPRRLQPPRAAAG